MHTDRRDKNDIVIMIPAYNPDIRFIDFLSELKAAGYKHIFVIDDGSRAETKHYFETAETEYGCVIVRHAVNLGQGRAYKSGFNTLLTAGNEKKYKDIIGVIQCDCDGQHQIGDVNQCADILRENPEKFVLGVRNFSDRKVPFRSRFGNKVTSLVFKLFCGLDIRDTQTGLKGIPVSFIPHMLEIAGERFEYASTTLLETRDAGLDLIQFPIETIYIDGNASSHFNPLSDSIRIYGLILRYLFSSLSSFVVDIFIYSLFISLLRPVISEYYIIISVYAARAVSCTYAYFFNKNVVFRNKSAYGRSAPVKFVLLCIMQSLLSGLLTTVFVYGSNRNEVLCKIVVDTVLFFASFQVQSRWVFKKRMAKLNE